MGVGRKTVLDQIFIVKPVVHFKSIYGWLGRGANCRPLKIFRFIDSVIRKCLRNGRALLLYAYLQISSKVASTDTAVDLITVLLHPRMGLGGQEQAGEPLYKSRK